MTVSLPPELLRDYERTSRLEWLETDGLGGYAMSTVSGAHTRRYHGLLVAATRPPVDRMVLLSRLDETVRVAGRAVELGTARFPGAVHPRGYQRLARFERGLFPVFEYDLAGVREGGGAEDGGATSRLRKTIAAVRGEYTVAVLYEIVPGGRDAGAAPGPTLLELRPFYAVRGYHELGRATRSFAREATLAGDVLSYQAWNGAPVVHLRVPGARFEASPDWWLRFELQEELDRGFDGHEDLFTPGVLRVELSARGRLGVLVSTAPLAGRDAFALVAAERRRRGSLLGRPRTAAVGAPAVLGHGGDASSGAASDATSAAVSNAGSAAASDARSTAASDFLDALALAADQFLVRRGERGTTVIAGYPWFTDWGRDTMIALPGLCLVTGRHAEAKGILRAFAAAVDRGMVPNRFPDGAETPEYNTVDATLWFFVAIRRYLDATGDQALVRGELLPVLRDVLAWHRRGTRHGIRQDQDGLLYGGEQGVQLTWMDARVGDWVVTPRRGKPVEIQALWYNALRILADLERRFGGEAEAVALEADALEADAERARRRFVELFWNPAAGCLRDCVDQRDGEPAREVDERIRPNQILALSLPYELLDPERAAAVLRVVEAKLLTPFGLRSLDPAHPDYRARYQGGPEERDGVYHQGAVWSWLLGPFLTALVRLRGGDGRLEARRILARAAAHLAAGCVGSVSEIFDAEQPFLPRGCPAQAWGVAEWLRAAVEEAELSLPPAGGEDGEQADAFAQTGSGP